MTQFVRGAVLCAGLCGAAFFARAEDAPPVKEAPKAAPKDAPKQPEKDADPGDEPDTVNREMYKFAPDADADTLVEFCHQLADYEPEDDAQQRVHDKKMPRAIRKACKRILDLEQDQESANARFARRYLLSMKLDTAAEIESKKSVKLIERAQAFLAAPNLAADDAAVAEALADLLGGHPTPKAIEWCEKIGAPLAENPGKELAAAGKLLKRTGKRLGLVGKPFHLTGTTVAGKTFDIASLKGKIVLVFFWASTYDHCVDEIPNLRTNYETWHDKGFEIVAVSADENRGELKEFLKAEQIPWINLHEKDGKHPALEEYAIDAFPTTVLVGKDGIAARLDVLGDSLGQQLEELLGETGAKKDAPKKDESAPKAKSKPKEKEKGGAAPKKPDDENDPDAADKEPKKGFSF